MTQNLLNLNIDFSLFTLKKEYFDYQGKLHNCNHVYRVMCHCLYIGSKLNLPRETKLAFCGAFIHDFSRKHDGLCSQHGLWATQEKFNLFKDIFLSVGVSEKDFEEIKLAVKNHSEQFDISKSHPFYKTSALLKDADALDRIRLGDDNLNPKYLRFNETHEFIPFAKELFLETRNSEIKNFFEILNIAKIINIFFKS